MWIKICGVRNRESARVAADCGADAIGLNFYDKSPRCVDLRQAASIAEAVPATLAAVGVFVNHTADQIRSICGVCGLRLVQLHGDEPAELLIELEGLTVIRALRTAGDFASVAAAQAAAERTLGTFPWAWLIDARVPQAYGGSGQTVDWASLGAVPREPDWPPLILAGGLTAENVQRAILTARPWGVDVAGGVESSPGVKDPALIQRFVERVRNMSEPHSAGNSLNTGAS